MKTNLTQGKHLNNEQLTPLLAQITQKIIQLLQAELKTLKLSHQESTFNAANMINYLLHKEGRPIATLSELNERYQHISFNQQHSPLIIQPEQYSPQAQKKLLDALTIHLSAIAAGFQAGSYDYSQQNHEEQTPIIQRVYYVGGYRHYDYYHDDFWRDMFFIHMLSDWNWHSHYHHGPSEPYTRRTSGESCDEDTMKAVVICVIVGCLLIAAAAVSAYLFFELGKTLEQLFHFENIISNSSKLLALGGGGFGGFLLGVMLAGALSVSSPALPIVIGICLALIIGAVSLGLTGKTFDLIKSHTSTNSAISQDTRFQLSIFEKARLKRRGFDVNEINEAIRELASCYTKTQSKTFSFNRDKTKLIKQLRLLKQGKIQSDYFYFNHKAFHIKKTPNIEPTPSEMNERPPAYNPEWSLFSPQPPSYQEACQNYTSPIASAPPMEMIKN